MIGYNGCDLLSSLLHSRYHITMCNCASLFTFTCLTVNMEILIYTYGV